MARPPREMTARTVRTRAAAREWLSHDRSLAMAPSSMAPVSLRWLLTRRACEEYQAYRLGWHHLDGTFPQHLRSVLLTGVTRARRTVSRTSSAACASAA